MRTDETDQGVTPGAQLIKWTSTLECLVRETDVSQVLNWKLN